MSLRKLLGIKDEVEEVREMNQESIEKAKEEVQEREFIDARLQAISIELQNVARK